MKKKFALSAAAVAMVAGSAFAAPQELQTFPGPFDLIADVGQVVTVTFTGAGGYTPAGIRFNYQLDSVATGTYANDVLVTINPPNGAAPRYYRSATTTFTTLPNVGGDFTIANIGIAPADAFGTWTFTFTDDYEDSLVGGPESILSNVRLSLLTSDAPTSSITIPAVDTVGTWKTASGTLAANGTTWFQLVVPAAINGTGLGNALDIDAIGTNLAPVNDASMGMFDSATGQLVAADFNFGPGELPQISFGKGIRPASGDGQLYNGQDGNALAAATYFIAVRGGDSTFTNLFGITGGAANAGPVTVRARYYETFTSLPPDQLYTNIINVGNVGTTTAGVENVQTSTYTIVTGSDVQWFKFATTAGTSDNASYYLDIDTEGSAEGVAETVAGLQDTEIGVYDTNGAMLVNDDDDGNGFRSALSFGDSVNIRTAIPPVAPATAGVARNGRDGALAAGNYWLAVATYDVTFGATGWNVSTTAVAGTVGERKVNFRSNLPVPPSCTCCNLSNVAGPNQSTTPDDSLTADDIIVFLGWFFANDARANVAGANQSTIPDNSLTADDIIVFLGRYFQGC